MTHYRISPIKRSLNKMLDFSHRITCRLGQLHQCKLIWFSRCCCKPDGNQVHRTNNLKSGTLKSIPPLSIYWRVQKVQMYHPLRSQWEIFESNCSDRSSVTVAADGVAVYNVWIRLVPLPRCGTVGARRRKSIRLHGCQCSKRPAPSMVFDSAITETAVKTNIGKVIPSMLVKQNMSLDYPKSIRLLGIK